MTTIADAKLRKKMKKTHEHRQVSPFTASILKEIFHLKPKEFFDSSYVVGSKLKSWNF